MELTNKQTPVAAARQHESFNASERETKPQELTEAKSSDVSQEVQASLPPPKITCGAPRWLVIVIYSFYCFLTGAAYFNWKPMADMLYYSGAYEWLCKEEELQLFAASGVPETRPRCVEQELALGRLFSAMSASEFGFAAFAGFLLDFLGPKLTAITGTVMAFSGWVLLAVGEKKLDTFIVASVLLGGSSEMCFYPVLPAADLFPGRESTVMGIFGTFRSISLVLPLIMRAANIDLGVCTFRGVVLAFACICIGSCFLLAVFFIPMKAWPRQADQLRAARKEKQKSCQTEEAHGDAATQQETFEATTTRLTGSSSRERAGKASTAWWQVYCGQGSYISEALSCAFLLMAVAYICVILDIMFFVPSTLHLIPSAYTANQIIQIFSFLPCPVLGYAVDRIGILWVMQFVNFCGFCTYLFVVLPRIPTYPVMQYIASIFSSIQVSFMSSQLYCYGSQYLSQRNLGKLIGTAFCLAGFVSLSTNPMRRFALEKGFAPMCWLAISLAGLAAALLCILQCMDSRQMLTRHAGGGKQTEKQTSQKQDNNGFLQQQTDVELACSAH